MGRPGKPAKREPNSSRMMTVEAKHDKPFRTFLDAIPRDHLMAVLATQPEESNFRTLLVLMQSEVGGRNPTFLASLCRKAGIAMHQMMNLMKDYAIAQGTVNMMLQLPSVMADVGEDARSKTRTCTACRGDGKITVQDRDKEGEPIGEPREETCLNCEGTGKVREIGDKHARDLIFEAAELKNRARGPLINQNFDMRDTGLRRVLMATQDLLEPGGKR